MFKDYPEAVENTLKIAERCNVTIKLDSTSTEKYPEFGTPDGSSREEYLRKVCYKGLEERYGKEPVEISLLFPDYGGFHQLGQGS